MEAKAPLQPGTRVVSIHDTEPGIIRAVLPLTSGGFAYEVETAYGIERWERRDFAVINEAEMPG